MDHPSRLSLMGAEVDVVTPAFVLDFVARRAATGRRTIVANHNLHSLYLHARRADMRAFYAQAALVEIDSTPLIAWAKLMGQKVSRAHRSTYLDFRDAFWTMVQSEGLGVYHVGGAPEVCDRSRAAIWKDYPAVRLDVHSGYFDLHGAGNEALLADIAAKRPDILLVGMGMPRQELWILNNLDRLPPCVIMPVGGAFDYEAGVQYQPPRWTGRLGMEWLARFVANPGRLFERYFVEPWALVPQILGDIALRLSGRGFEVLRAPLDDDAILAPWQRRQALSSETPLPEPAPVIADDGAANEKPHRILMRGGA